MRQGSGGVVAPPPRVRVKPVSTKRQQLNQELAKVVAEKRATVKYCEAQPLISAALAHPDNTPADQARYVQALRACSWRPDRPHHVLKRSRGSNATLIDSENILLVCDSCDDEFIEREYVLATRAGLLIPSSARTRLFGRIVA